MTDQELKEIRELWEKTGTWQDVPRLLNEVERLRKILSKAGLCSFCGEELDGELKTGGMLTGASVCYGCVDVIKNKRLTQKVVWS